MEVADAYHHVDDLVAVKFGIVDPEKDTIGLHQTGGELMVIYEHSLFYFFLNQSLKSFFSFKIEDIVQLEEESRAEGEENLHGHQKIGNICFVLIAFLF
jgi:hypothetical protein